MKFNESWHFFLGHLGGLTRMGKKDNDAKWVLRKIGLVIDSKSSFM